MCSGRRSDRKSSLCYRQKSITEGEIFLKNQEKHRKELCAFIKHEFERRGRERLKYELQWQLNINFFLGNQYCDILPEAGKLFQEEKAFSWQSREVYNHIAPIVESRLAKLNKVMPRVCVRPATDDEEDIQAARVSTAILNSAFARNSMDALINEATVWSELCGTVFYKQNWVNDSGMIVARVGEKNVHEGDISTVICPPQEIYPDNCMVQDISKCASVIHAHVCTCDYIRELWNVDVTPEKISTVSFGEITGALRRGDDEDDKCLLLEYYEQPSDKFENGRYIAVCGDQLLYEGELPYINGDGNTRKLPFVQQNSVSRPGCLWGVSVVERCIPIQRAYNAVRNRKHEYLARAAVGVLTVEEGTADVEELAENGLAPGKVLIYRQGANKPEMLTPASIPNEFTREENALLEEFNLISGTSDLMRQSVAPTNVSSGTALNVIAEQDDTRLAITADRIRDAIIEISRQWLRLFKQFAGAARIDRVVGKNGKISKLYWNASMLTSDDVVNETENELSDSLTSRKQLIYELLARGMFSSADGTLSQRTKGRILRALGMGDWENISDISEIHENRAMRENLLLKNGGNVTVLDTDDHEIHISEHAKVLLSEEFEENFGIDSDARRRFEEHIRKHKVGMEVAYNDGNQNKEDE